MILLADSEGPDQTARMRRLIWAFAFRICPKTRLCMTQPKCKRRTAVHIRKQRVSLGLYMRFCGECPFFGVAVRLMISLGLSYNFITTTRIFWRTLAFCYTYLQGMMVMVKSFASDTVLIPLFLFIYFFFLSLLTFLPVLTFYIISFTFFPSEVTNNILYMHTLVLGTRWNRVSDTVLILNFEQVNIIVVIQSNLNSSNTDSSFTMANSNSFLSPYNSRKQLFRYVLEKFPI